MAISTIDNNGVNLGQLGNRNLIQNGNFSVSQRGTSFTADNVYTLDRWKSSDGTGGSPARTLSQQVFTLGQTDVPNAHYYLRHAQTGASTNGNSSLVQKIEDVTRSAGQTITFSFYAKANASMTVDVRFIQDFGTGGSPSSDVILTETITIGTSWAKFTLTKDIGSLSGKTLGTDGVHTSSLDIDMEFQPTGTFTFEIAQVQLEVGDTATPFEHRSYGAELALCLRYFEKFDYANTQFVDSIGYANASSTASCMLSYSTKRAAPTITLPPAGTSGGKLAFLTGGGGYPSPVGTLSVQLPSITSARIFGTGFGGYTIGQASGLFASGACSITIDSEL